MNIDRLRRPDDAGTRGRRAFARVADRRVRDRLRRTPAGSVVPASRLAGPEGEADRSCCVTRANLAILPHASRRNLRAVYPKRTSNRKGEGIMSKRDEGAV